MGEESDSSANRSPPADRVQSEYGQPTRGERDQAGADPQQAGLSGPVRPFHEDRLSHGHLEIYPGQEWEPTRERDRATQGYGRGRGSDRGHGLRQCYGGGRSVARRGISERCARQDPLAAVNSSTTGPGVGPAAR